jgi:hypothetical protein
MTNSLQIDELIALRSSLQDAKAKACISQKIWRLRHPEKAKEIGRAKYQKVDKTTHEYKRSSADRVKKYALAHPEKVKARQKAYLISKRNTQDFKAKHAARNLRYRLRNIDSYRAKKRVVQSEWVKANPEKAKNCYVQYRANMTEDQRKEYYARQTFARSQKETYRIETRLRARCRKAVIAAGSKKASKTQQLVGADWQTVRAWIESKFTQGMTWDNIGMWHIDHIKPCVSFNLTQPEEQFKCFHYTNLQPLWAKDNLSKGSKAA